MPLIKTTLEAQIIAIMATLSTNQDPAVARQEFAQKLATAIDAYIRSGTVVTTGTAATQTGAIT